MREEAIREPGSCVKLAHHVGLFDMNDRGWSHRRRRGHSPRLARQTALAEKMPGLEHGNHGLFPRVR
jgi:hypothetical protein